MLYGKPKYVSKSIKRPAKVIKKLNSGKLSIGYYVITYSNNTEMLDIYPGYVFKQQFFRDMDMIVVGLAGSKSDAFDLIAKIAEDSLAKTGECNLKKYLLL